MEHKVFSVKGEEIRTVKLNEAVFGREVSDGSIYNAILNELANKRVGTASSKTRSEVAGSHAKPWRQKGTGRARSGTKQSPVWVGGGIAFGPRPKSFNYSIPKKVKRLAMKSILSLKVKEERLKVVENFTIESGKTKDLAAILDNFGPHERTVVILGSDDAMVKRAGNNIPWLKFLAFNRLRAHDLFYGKNVIVLEDAVEKLNEFYGEKA